MAERRRTRTAWRGTQFATHTHTRYRSIKVEIKAVCDLISDDVHCTERIKNADATGQSKQFKFLWDSGPIIANTLSLRKAVSHCPL